MAQQAQDHWFDEYFENHESGNRIAGETEDDLVPAAAENGWHARLDSDLFKMEGDAGCFHGRGHEIEIPGRNPAGKDQHVALAKQRRDRAVVASRSSAIRPKARVAPRALIWAASE